LQWPALLLAWTVLSSLWSDDPSNAIPKAAVLLISTLAAWRATSIVTVEEMFSCLYYSLAALLLTSVALVIFVPTIGVVQHEWQHVGNWQGVFGTKQGLGMASAVFLGIVLLRVARRRTLFDVAMCGVGLACLLGSESRGAGVMAFVAVACLVVARKHPKLALVVTAVLLLDMLLAVANISYFTTTGEASILVFGYDINFTERTFIWQYALSHWPDRPLLGFGLNGFWTNSDVYYAYQRLHGWVLDNYHNGYLAIIVETGVVGFGLFSIVAIQLAIKLRYLMANVTMRRLSLDMSTGFLLMFFTINLTETYFLRSTNFLSVLFAFLVIKILSAPDHTSRLSVTAPRRVSPRPMGAGVSIPA
jgi:O-antigen ligase